MLQTGVKLSKRTENVLNSLSFFLDIFDFLLYNCDGTAKLADFLKILTKNCFGDKMNLTHETHRLKDPRVPFFFHVDIIKKDDAPIIARWHENVELICIEEGSGFISIDEERREYGVGDIALISPNKLHGFRAVDSDMKYMCFIIDRAFFTANYFDSNDFVFSPKIRDEELVCLMREFKKYHAATSEEEPMRIQHLRSAALRIMLLICEKHANFDKSPKTDSHLLSSIKKSIGYVKAESEREISLDEISSFVGLSKFYFTREFRRITGYSFVDYQKNVRCERARGLLLATDESIKEIGLRCGFENQSYFSKIFKEYSGLTPCEYRKKNK